MKSAKWILGMFIISWLGACSQPVIPTSEIEEAWKPLRYEEIKSEKQLATKMFQSVVNRLENGTLAVLLVDTEAGLNPREAGDGERSLLSQCQQVSECRGTVYASIHRLPEGSELLYRVHDTRSLQARCAWVEIYAREFTELNAETRKHILARVRHWGRECLND